MVNCFGEQKRMMGWVERIKMKESCWEFAERVVDFLLSC